jgi:hypothetical protein
MEVDMKLAAMPESGESADLILRLMQDRFEKDLEAAQLLGCNSESLESEAKYASELIGDYLTRREELLKTIDL